jgi:hypothetical protein
MGEGVFTVANGDTRHGKLLRPLFDIVMRAQERGNIALFQQEAFGTTSYIALKVSPGFHERVKEIANVNG